MPADSHCHTDKGWSLCPEVGFGVGEGAEISTTPVPGPGRAANAPGFGLAADGLDTAGELKGGCGPAQLGVNFSLDRCGKGNCSGQAAIFVADCRTGDTSESYQIPFGERECDISAKLAARNCVQSTD